jgi:hypothetical protein
MSLKNLNQIVLHLQSVKIKSDSSVQFDDWQFFSKDIFFVQKPVSIFSQCLLVTGPKLTVFQ